MSDVLDFVVAFLVCFALNSLGFVPENLSSLAGAASQWLLLIAISALEVRTSLAAVLGLGPCHLILIVSETVFSLVLAIRSVSLL